MTSDQAAEMIALLRDAVNGLRMIVFALGLITGGIVVGLLKKSGWLK